MTITVNQSDKFQFLAEAALDAGAAAAIIIPAELVAIEDRVRMKCRSGCPSYGRYLTCPPNAPDIEEFRRCLGNYHFALLVKFKSRALLGEEIRDNILWSLYNPDADPSSRENAGRFMRDLALDNRSLNRIMLELEKMAFNAGYPFAVTTVCGTCGLCEKCNTATGICNHPTMKRFPPEALGINVVKTTEDAGIAIRFPSPANPDRVAILLIE
jgi:predicted metal-binding protein